VPPGCPDVRRVRRVRVSGCPGCPACPGVRGARGVRMSGVSGCPGPSGRPGCPATRPPGVRGQGRTCPGNPGLRLHSSLVVEVPLVRQQDGRRPTRDATWTRRRGRGGGTWETGRPGRARRCSAPGQGGGAGNGAATGPGRGERDRGPGGPPLQWKAIPRRVRGYSDRENRADRRRPPMAGVDGPPGEGRRGSNGRDFRRVTTERIRRTNHAQLG